MKRLMLLLVIVALTACGGKQNSSEEVALHDPPDDPVVDNPENVEEVEPVEEIEFPDALIRLVDETGKVRLHVTSEGDVMAKGQVIGTMVDGKFTDAKGRVLMEVKKDALHSGKKKLGDFSDDDLTVNTPDGMVGLDENGNLVSRIKKSNEVYRSVWYFPSLPEAERRHALILAIAFQNQMQLKEQN